MELVKLGVVIGLEVFVDDLGEAQSRLGIQEMRGEE